VNAPTDTPLLAVDDVHRTYRMGRDVEVHALRGVTFDVDAGDYLAIIGSSGSGKSTLLNLLGALDRPTAGRFASPGKTSPGCRTATWPGSATAGSASCSSPSTCCLD
jgi:ABC-type lipoprotein export system ATPase subunit